MPKMLRPTLESLCSLSWLTILPLMERHITDQTFEKTRGYDFGLSQMTTNLAERFKQRALAAPYPFRCGCTFNAGRILDRAWSISLLTPLSIRKCLGRMRWCVTVTHDNKWYVCRLLCAHAWTYRKERYTINYVLQCIIFVYMYRYRYIFDIVLLPPVAVAVVAAVVVVVGVCL